MKKFAKFLVAACVLVGANALSAEVIKVGTNANFPPFEYLDENNTITGFDIELVDVLSKKVGFDYEIVNMGFDGLIPALKSGKIDMVASGMSATEARKKAADFTDSYFVTENVFIKRASDDSIKTKDDIKAKSVGTQLGTVQEIAIRELKGIKPVTMEDPITVILALKNGKIDAAVFDTSVAYGYIKENPELVEFHKEPDGSEGFSFAFNKGKKTELVSKINDALRELKEDGTFDKLLDKYNLK
ncbi:basic amino acid ABC transporter substrate-binding protein [Campylobacter corcagiensis]|uniref:Basic amino acid ABC transporter substrate-binding protein n=1 Tax=Campylobacter corcagiensis TaxID=1448857 RepID=A0A7M1LG76_9BACT|nr:basic amino acid ABC transporter substrate-binding protein [Campylobacter corcagiensis]QKF64206.1 amino acid ABC transporter, periplasmic arginine/lysine/histidine-binding protein [Campylobacter corcagiensis]QOQ87599.1 basic amino acid ABC transporter substrate-binding protein [Campylobacter corcagiensis]